MTSKEKIEREALLIIVEIAREFAMADYQMTLGKTEADIFIKRDAAKQELINVLCREDNTPYRSREHLEGDLAYHIAAVIAARQLRKAA